MYVVYVSRLPRPDRPIEAEVFRSLITDLLKTDSRRIKHSKIWLLSSFFIDLSLGRASTYLCIYTHFCYPWRRVCQTLIDVFTCIFARLSRRVPLIPTHLLRRYRLLDGSQISIILGESSRPQWACGRMGVQHQEEKERELCTQKTTSTLLPPVHRCNTVCEMKSLLFSVLPACGSDVIDRDENILFSWRFGWKSG